MTADTLAAGLASLAAIVFPIAGGWAWNTHGNISALLTRSESEKEWREDFKKRFDRFEEKIDDLRESSPHTRKG